MTTDTQPDTFAPGWFVKGGVSHYFKASARSLCGAVKRASSCVRRRSEYTAVRGQTLTPEAAPCRACRKLHTRMWCGT